MEQIRNENNSTQQTENADSGLVQVPDLVGKTEEEAKALVEEVNLGTQMIGEEPSTQGKRKDFFPGYSRRHHGRGVYDA